MNRHHAAMLLLVLLLPSVVALSIKTDKANYVKGESIRIEGACDRKLGSNLTITYGEKIIFRRNIDCSIKDDYYLEYEISFLDPVGNWILKLENQESSFVKKISVLPSPHSAYYVVRFLSPSPGRYRKTEDISISIKLTDAGNAVEDANVSIWDVGGNRIELNNRGNGLYSIDYEIPYDTNIGEWKILVTATSKKDGKSFGGENNATIEIGEAPIIIDIIEPQTQSFDIKVPITIKTRITYFNGKEVAEEAGLKASAGIRERKYAMRKVAPSTYQFDYTPEFSELGSLTALIEAEDNALNAGSTHLDLIIKCPPTCMIANYGIYALAALVITAILLIIFRGKTARHLQLKMLENEKRKTIELIKALQKEYFERGIMSYHSYKKNLGDYEARIVEIDEKIRRLKETKEL